MDQIFDPKLHSPGGRDELTQQKQENLPQNGGGCRQLSAEEILSQQTSNITRSSCRGGCHDSFQTVTSCGLAATNNPTSSKTVLRHTFRPGQATNSIFFYFLFVKTHWFAWRANQWPLSGETLFSSVPPSNSLVSISDHWMAFWVETAPFKGPRLASWVASGITVIQVHWQVCCTRRKGPRTVYAMH